MTTNADFDVSRPVLAASALFGVAVTGVGGRWLLARTGNLFDHEKVSKRVSKEKTAMYLKRISEALDYIERLEHQLGCRMAQQNKPCGLCALVAILDPEKLFKRATRPTPATRVAAPEPVKLPTPEQIAKSIVYSTYKCDGCGSSIQVEATTAHVYQPCDTCATYTVWTAS